MIQEELTKLADEADEEEDEEAEAVKDDKSASAAGVEVWPDHVYGQFTMKSSIKWTVLELSLQSYSQPFSL